MKPLQAMQVVDSPPIFDVDQRDSFPYIMKRQPINVRASTVADGLDGLDDEGMEDNLEIK